MDTVTIDSILKRVFILLEDGKWESANDCCERVLDMAPENPHAYLGKLLAEFQCHTKEELKNCKKTFGDSLNFKRVIRYCDRDLVNELNGYLAEIECNVKAAQKKKQKMRVMIAAAVCVILISAILIVPGAMRRNEQKKQAAVVEALVGTTWVSFEDEYKFNIYFVDENNYIYTSINTETGYAIEENHIWEPADINGNIMEIKHKKPGYAGSYFSKYIWFSVKNGDITIDNVRSGEDIFVSGD